MKRDFSLVSVKTSKTIETSTASVLNKESECLFNKNAVFHLITSILKVYSSQLSDIGRYLSSTLEKKYRYVPFSKSLTSVGR